MCSKQERKTDRRQEILEAAFALTAEKKKWSLGDLAERIGLSKTALYRHFDNREAIENAMQEDLCAALRRMIETESHNGRSIRLAIATFLREHPGYLFHLLHNLAMDNAYAEKMIASLSATSPVVKDYFSSIETLPQEEKNRKGVDVLKNAISILIASFPVKNIERMQNALIDVLEKGIPPLAVPDSARLDELDEICAIRSEELDQSNRLFDAIAASIREFGMHQTTIETIADKMGTAKSSLYFYSKNKTTMLRGLIESETSSIVRLCSARAAFGKTLAEQLYVNMAVQTNYLLMKPDIIPVFNWVRYETIGTNPGHPERFWDAEEILKPYRFGELFPGGEINIVYASMTIRWAAILGTSFVIRGIEQGIDEADIRKGIRMLLESMLLGDER